VILGKEDICVYWGKTRETKGSPDIRAEDSILGNATERPVHSIGWHVLQQQFWYSGQIQWMRGLHPQPYFGRATCVSGSCGNVPTILVCNSWGSFSSAVEDSGLLGCDLVSLGKWFPTFQWNTEPSWSRFKHQDKCIFIELLDPLHLQYHEPLSQQHSITSQNWIFILLLCPTCF
jgi:hypothetical protein